MEQDQQPENNVLEHRLNEMAAVVEEMRRQQSQMQSEMQRQAEIHEKERKRWHEECQKMQQERERLLEQERQRLLKQEVAEKEKPKVTGLHMMSRVIGGSKTFRPHNCFGNRTRHVHALSEEFREKILEEVRQKREALVCHLQKQRQAVETDLTVKALDTLSITEQNKKQNPLSINSPSTSQLPNFQAQLDGNFVTYERQIEDYTKRRRMQQQLGSILHAQNCERNQVNPLGYMTCGMPFCSVTSRVLEHIRTCTFVTKCPIPTCSLTREVLVHYKNCTTDNCQICQQAKLESVTTQEHLRKFVDTIDKGLDEEASVETPCVPNIINPPVNPILHPNITGMPSLPRLIRPILAGGSLFPIMEMPNTINIVPLSSMNPAGGLFNQMSAPILQMPAPMLQMSTSVLQMPAPMFMPPIYTNSMEAQTEGSSTEATMDSSDSNSDD